MGSYLHGTPDHGYALEINSSLETLLHVLPTLASLPTHPTQTSTAAE